MVRGATSNTTLVTHSKYNEFSQTNSQDSHSVPPSTSTPRPPLPIFGITKQRRDSVAHASAPTNSDHRMCESTMRIAAPQRTESNQSLSTLISEASHHSLPKKLKKYGSHRRKSRRNLLGRGKSTETVVQLVLSNTFASPSSSSLPIPIPRVHVEPPTPGGSVSPKTVPSENLKSDDEHNTEWTDRLPLPLPGKPLAGNMLLPKRLPRSARRHSSSKPSLESWPSMYTKYLTCRTPDQQAKILPWTESRPPRKQDSVVFQRDPNKLTGTYRGPPYAPFTRLSRPGRKIPPINKHAAFVDLRDCWHCPEADLTALLLRSRNADLDPATLAEHMGAENWTDEEPRENTPLLMRAQYGLPERPMYDVGASTPAFAEDTGTGIVCRAKRFLPVVFWPLIAICVYFFSSIKRYLREREAVAGSLGSYETETARWLRHRDAVLPQDSDYLEATSYRTAYGSMQNFEGGISVVCYNRRASSDSYVSAPSSRSHSRRSTGPDDIRGVLGTMRWGNGIGDEYDLC